jgi:hypothetical protein
MKKSMIMMLLIAFMTVGSVPAYASDWDKAGIILTGIEGLRIVSGGNVDLIGSMFGIGNQKNHVEYSYEYRSKHHKKFTNRYQCFEKVWVPHYVWERRYVPKHVECRDGHKKVIVEAHYIEHKIERGGHWEQRDYCG